MQVGAGILGALAVAASAAGWWLLGGAVLAAALAFCAQWTVPEPEGRGATIHRGLRSGARIASVAFYASVFAAYSVPGSAWLGACVFVLLVTAADAAGVGIGDYWRRWIAGLLVVAGVAFVAVSVAIAPAGPTGEPSWPGVPGLLLAGAVLFPLLTGLDSRRLATGAVLVVAVAAAALYQLGPVRLGLSVSSLRDALAAANAEALQPLLGGVVVLAIMPAALLALTEARQDLRPHRRLVGTAACGLASAVLAVVLTPVGALFVAAAFALAQAFAAALLTRERTAPVVATAVLAVALFAGLVFGA
ncbi:hypothetical protein DI005_14475 [Prauserella sp. PE36]|uniref:hypothetical protein n=1 Tax=Prauserella sp. PE36 TaxID=1504709 RepID=UPI000DE276F0|nr:hypothetical protein [Prauserella sp. PE36]RBM20055.1 hypothetical protein DI005_14475 [Prauserella sp. PE36]